MPGTRAMATGGKVRARAAPVDRVWCWLRFLEWPKPPSAARHPADGTASDVRHTRAALGQHQALEGRHRRLGDARSCLQSDAGLARAGLGGNRLPGHLLLDASENGGRGDVLE